MKKLLVVLLCLAASFLNSDLKADQWGIEYKCNGLSCGGGSCNLCVVESGGSIKYSCKAMLNETCSTTYKVPPFGPTVTLTCVGAKEC